MHTQTLTHTHTNTHSSACPNITVCVCVTALSQLANKVWQQCHGRQIFHRGGPGNSTWGGKTKMSLTLTKHYPSYLYRGLHIWLHSGDNRRIACVCCLWACHGGWIEQATMTGCLGTLNTQRILLERTRECLTTWIWLRFRIWKRDDIKKVSHCPDINTECAKQ